MGDEFAPVILGLHIKHTFAPDCIGLKQFTILNGLFAVGFGDGDCVLELDLLVMGILLGRLFVEIEVGW